MFTIFRYTKQRCGWWSVAEEEWKKGRGGPSKKPWKWTRIVQWTRDVSKPEETRRTPESQKQSGKRPTFLADSAPES